MEKKHLLEKISSKYLLKSIISYIKEVNLIYKLIHDCKNLQKKFDLELNNYKLKYIEKRIKFEDYLFEESKSSENDFLNQKLKIDLSQYQIDENDEKAIKNYVIYYFKKYFEKKNENGNNNYITKFEKIHINSPFFDSLLKSDIFPENFTIIMNMDNEKHYFKKFISKYDMLNKLNIKFSSLEIDYPKEEDIDYIKQLKIFSNIKKLNIKVNSLSGLILDKLFGNNIVYLDLYSTLGWPFNNFYDLKSLKYLKLTKFKYGPSEHFKLNISNLLYLHLESCENISFEEEENILKLKYLYLDYCKLNKPISLFKCPELETCTFIGCRKTNYYVKYDLIFDFKSLHNLKSFKGVPLYFFLLYEKKNLEKVSITTYRGYNHEDYILNTIEDEEEVIKKLLLMKNIKELELKLVNIEHNKISEIKGKNTSVTKMEIFYNEIKLFSLQEKFPNLLYLYIKTCTEENMSPYLIIKENKNCKINNLEIDMDKEQIIKTYCGPYKKMESIKFFFKVNIELKNSFPIFYDKCQILFKSLLIFKFNLVVDYKINFNNLKNIANNIDKMPNLNEFQLACECNKDIGKIFYKKFIKKILKLIY